MIYPRCETVWPKSATYIYPCDGTRAASFCLSSPTQGRREGGKFVELEVARAGTAVGLVLPVLLGPLPVPEPEEKVDKLRPVDLTFEPHK